MHDVAPDLLQTVGVDRQSADVSVLDQLLRDTSVRCIVQRAVCVDSFRTAFEIGMADDVFRGIVYMLPHERDLGPIVVLERVLANNPSVRA